MTALRLEIPDKMLPFVTRRSRHKIARGGRGSGKSWSIARILVSRAVAAPERWLCCREIQRSIKMSSKRLIEDQIAALGVRHLFDIQRDVIYGPGKSEFAFVGLQDHTVESIKSYEGYDGAWVEEADKISEQSAEILIPTIRMPGSEILWTYNPTLELDYVHRMANTPDPDTLVVDISWRDNPWFPPELELERLKLLRLNPDLYQHVWEGKCRSDSGAWIKRAWFKRYESLPATLSYYLTTDWAATADGGDWTVHIVWGVSTGGDLYAVDLYRGQVDTGVGIDAALALVARYRPRVWYGEKGVIERAIEPSVIRRMRERDARIHRELLPAVGSKAERLTSFAARAEYGSVYLPNSQWANGLLDELAAFTGERDGEVDDQCDACGLIGRAVDALQSPRDPSPVASPIIPFTERWIMQDEDNDKRNQPRIY